MSKIARAAAIMALSVAPLAIGHAQAQSASFVPPPGAAPPWADATAATEAPTAPTPVTSPAPAATMSVPIAPTTQTDEESTSTAIPIAVTPMQGMTTPRQPVSLRSGPNTSFPVIGTLRPGMPLRILATANYGWMQVETPQGTGWTYGSYLAQGGAVPDVQQPGLPPETISH